MLGFFLSGRSALRGAVEAGGSGLQGVCPSRLGTDSPATRPVWGSNPRPPASES